jgi:hypothetical protein
MIAHLDTATAERDHKAFATLAEQLHCMATP